MIRMVLILLMAAGLLSAGPPPVNDEWLVWGTLSERDGAGAMVQYQLQATAQGRPHRWVREQVAPELLAKPAGFALEIGTKVFYEGEARVVKGFLTARHVADGMFYTYYKLALQNDEQAYRWAWTGWVEESGVRVLDDGDPGTNPPPNGGCPEPPGPPC